MALVGFVCWSSPDDVLIWNGDDGAVSLLFMYVLCKWGTVERERARDSFLEWRGWSEVVNYTNMSSTRDEEGKTCGNQVE